MKVTGIVRFDGSAKLITEAEDDEFENFENMYKYCSKMGIEIRILHAHPASGLRINGGRSEVSSL